MSTDPFTLLTGAPLTLTHDQTNQADVQSTKMLLDAYRQDDAWHCPRCPFTTTNADDFAQHLIDEFAAAMATLAQIQPKIRKPAITGPPPTTPPPTSQKSPRAN